MNTGVLSLGVIVLYLVAMLVITVIHGRRKKKASALDFFLANRGVNSILLPLTMIAAMQSTLPPLFSVIVHNFNDAHCLAVYFNFFEYQSVRMHQIET